MAIQFYLTNAGKNAVLNAASIGLNVSLTHIAIGSGKYDPSNPMSLTNTALVSEIERYPLNGGSVEPNSQTLRFIANIEPSQTADGYEIGLITDQGVLFAIAATTLNTPLIRLIANIVSIISLGMLLTNIDISNLKISIDPSTPIMVALMNQHLEHNNPHPQYALISALKNALDRIEVLENRIVEDIKIGDIYVTTLDFANSAEVKAHKKYGDWIRFAEGLTLVGKSTKQDDPIWTKQIGNVFGENNHTLSIPEMPGHNHIEANSPYNKLTASMADIVATDADGLAGTNPVGQASPSYNNTYIQTSDITTEQYSKMTIKNAGGSEPHNNIQPSKVVGMWLRIA